VPQEGQVNFRFLCATCFSSRMPTLHLRQSIAPPQEWPVLHCRRRGAIFVCPELVERVAPAVKPKRNSGAINRAPTQAKANHIPKQKKPPAVQTVGGFFTSFELISCRPKDDRTRYRPRCPGW
jgi:hypothetical protein